MSELLIIYPGSTVNHDCVFNLMVAKTGENLASHLCSNASYAKGDLYSTRPSRIEEYQARFGEVDIKFIDETSIDADDLFALNQAYYSKKDEI